jgi:hypothetical protein
MKTSQHLQSQPTWFIRGMCILGIHLSMHTADLGHCQTGM